MGKESPGWRGHLGRISLYVTALWILVVCVADLYRVNATKSWVPVQGVISSFNIESKTERVHDGEGVSERHYFIPRASFTYEVDGQSFESHHIARNRLEFTSAKVRQSFLDQFSTGNSVTVYHAPDSPQQSVLIRGISEHDSAFPTILFRSSLCFCFLINGFVAVCIRKMQITKRQMYTAVRKCGAWRANCAALWLEGILAGAWLAAHDEVFEVFSALSK